MNQANKDNSYDIHTNASKTRSSGKARIGVFNAGFHRYWPQFPGLKEQLEAYRVEFENRLREFDVEVISGGLVDDVDSGRRVGDFFCTRGRRPDFLLGDNVCAVGVCTSGCAAQQGAHGAGWLAAYRGDG